MKTKTAIYILILTSAVAAAVLSAAQAAPASGKLRVLYNFTPCGKSDTGGCFPTGLLTFDKAGNLYGAAAGGGGFGCDGNGCGIVFELTSRSDDKWIETVLHRFAGGQDGAFPDGGVIFDSIGNLFGAMSGNAGAARSGVFELSPGPHGWRNTVIYSPGGCCLVLGETGHLYGSMGAGDYGGGAISELIHGSKGWSLKTLYSFCDPNCGYGEGPLAPLSWDAAGNLYGTTYFGGNGPPKCLGSLGCGVAFKMTPNHDGGWTYHVIHRFANFKTDGQYPYGGLTVDRAGNVYGTTTEGGKFGNGTVFEFTPTTGGHWKQAVLYDFPNIYLGGAPGGNLVFDLAGNLYGTAGGGNLSCPQTCGVIFKLTPQAGGKWKYSLVHKFDGADGDSPNGLTMDGAGNLYGTTFFGGKYNYGVAFKLTP
jgi:uncharacterized repeat protein (TIGR03803 family)